MGWQEDAEPLARSRMAWRRPSRKEVAEQLGGQQVARGRQVSRRALGAKRTPEGPGASSSREGAGWPEGCRIPGSQKGSKQLGLHRPVRSGHRRMGRAPCSPAGGQGALQPVRTR